MNEICLHCHLLYFSSIILNFGHCAFWGVKTHFGKLPMKRCIFRHEKKNTNQYYVEAFLYLIQVFENRQAQHPNDGLPEEFICDRCDTGLDYKTERALLKHYFKDHGTLPSLLENTKKYICSQCPNIYTKKTSFDAHMRSKHSNAPRRYIKSQYQGNWLKGIDNKTIRRNVLLGL